MLAAAGPAALAGYATNDTVPASRACPRPSARHCWAPCRRTRWAALYLAIEPKPDEQQAAVKDDKPPDARVRAVLYSIARSSAPAATRETAIARLFADGKKRDAFRAHRVARGAGLR